MIRQPVRLGNGLPKPVPRYLICAAPSDISAGSCQTALWPYAGARLEGFITDPATSRVKPMPSNGLGRDPAIYPPPSDYSVHPLNFYNGHNEHDDGHRRCHFHRRCRYQWRSKPRRL